MFFFILVLLQQFDRKIVYFNGIRTWIVRVPTRLKHFHWLNIVM